jgi:dihydrofolate reductase
VGDSLKTVDATLLISIPAMSKIVLGLGSSLDGYIARDDGTLDFLFMPRDYSMAPFFATVDAAIMGRKTLDAARSGPPGERDGVVFTNRSLAAIVREPRNERGKDIWLMGGGELAREFLKADLIDELYRGIVPRLIGEGIPLVPSGFRQRDFSLVENRTYSKGMIALKYRRMRSKGKRKS